MPKTKLPMKSTNNVPLKDQTLENGFSAIQSWTAYTTLNPSKTGPRSPNGMAFLVASQMNLSIKATAALAGVAYDTAQKWLNHHPDHEIFREHVNAARARPLGRIAESVLVAAEQDAKIGLEVLARRDPEAWSKAPSTAVNVDARSVTTTNNVVLADSIREALGLTSGDDEDDSEI